MRALVLLVVCWLTACGSDFSSANVGGSPATGGSTSSSSSEAGSSTTGSSTSSSSSEAGSPTTGGTSATGGSTSSSSSKAGSSATGGTSAAIARVLSLGSAGASSSTSIHTTIELVNVSPTDWVLSQFRLRYWFTAELATGASLVPDVGSGLFSQRVSIGTVIPARTGADHYIEITFTSGTILAGAKEQLSFECHQANWAAFDQSDDYSYPAGIVDGAELVTVGVYRNSVLIAGVEP